MKLPYPTKNNSTMKSVLLPLIATRDGWAIRQVLKGITILCTSLTTWFIAQGVDAGTSAAIVAGIGAALSWGAELGLSKLASKIATPCLALLACLTLSNCTAMQQDAAKEELKFIGIQVAEAASKAAAEVALQTAERKLIDLEKSPVPENPLAAMARTVAISKAWDLVAQARAKLADFHFTSGK
jgi:hypothetical protein